MLRLMSYVFQRSVLLSFFRLLVVHFPEREALGGGYEVGGGCWGFGQHLLDHTGGKFFLADLHQRADDFAAHFVEKAIAVEVDGDGGSALLHAAFVERAGAGTESATSFYREGAEVVMADELRGGGLHGG